jgi:hypothetical protein
LASGLAFLAALIGGGCQGPTLHAVDKGPIEALQQYRPKCQINNDGRVIDLKLEGRRVPASALVEVGKLTELRKLSLYAAKLTDESLENLSGLGDLEALGLGATPISDQGLVHLEKLVSLHSVWLPKTTDKISEQRIEELKRALPGLVVYRQD